MPGGFMKSKFLILILILILLITSCSNKKDDELNEFIDLLESQIDTLEKTILEQDSLIKKQITTINEQLDDQESTINSKVIELSEKFDSHKDTIINMTETAGDTFSGTNDILINAILGKYDNPSIFIGVNKNVAASALSSIYLNLPESSTENYLVLSGKYIDGSLVYSEILQVTHSSTSPENLENVDADDSITRIVILNLPDISYDDNTVLMVLSFNDEEVIKTTLLENIGELFNSGPES